MKLLEHEMTVAVSIVYICYVPQTHIVFIVQIQSTPPTSMRNTLQNINGCSSNIKFYNAIATFASIYHMHKHLCSTDSHMIDIDTLIYDKHPPYTGVT